MHIHFIWTMQFVMRDAIELAAQITAAALFLSVMGAAIVVIWFIVGGQS